MFTTGKERAQQALNIYSHIDYLRPYFDVEPKDVLNRLIYSLVPIELHQPNYVRRALRREYERTELDA